MPEFRNVWEEMDYHWTLWKEGIYFRYTKIKNDVRVWIAVRFKW